MTTASNPGNYVDFDEYVGLKLEKTQSSIRKTDVLTAVFGVTAMFLAYLLVFVIFDQWVIHNGFTVFWRWILLSSLMIATAAWLAWKVGLNSFLTVSGLFAARQIEKAEPQLKSNLLNLVDLKAAGRPVNPAILRAMERQAAVRLQQVDIAQAVDHRPLVRTLYILLAIIIVCCFYAMISPKKVLNSIWRGLLPASQVPLATITEILDVKPGSLSIPAHQPSVDIQVDLGGEIPAQVYLYYSSADGQRDQQVELHADQAGQPRFRGQIVGESGQGLMQDLTYSIHAGDATSRQFKITVEQPPFAEVESVGIEFPVYMKLQPIEQFNNGAIDTWEGAKVLLNAKTNMPVRTASVQFLDDPQSGPNGEEVTMSVVSEGRKLQALWTLALRSDGTFPKYYRIHCKTDDGRVTTGHVVNPITIRPDLPPDVAILEPERDIEAAANATIPLLIQARDPDFELGYLYLNIETAGQRIVHEILSEGRQPRLALKHDLDLVKLNAKVGDLFDFWIEAYDNKQPRPNSKNTPKLKIRVTPPVSKKEAEQELARQKERQDQKFTDAENELNRDQAPNAEQKESEAGERPPEDRTPPRDADRNQAEKPQENKSQNGDRKQSAPQDQKNPDQQNQKGNSQQGSGQSQSGQKNTNQKSDDSGQKQAGEREKSSQKLNNDGSQDEEALRRINEILNKNLEEKSDPEKQKPDSESTEKPQPASDKSQPNDANQQQKNKSDSQSKDGAEPDKQPSQSDKQKSGSSNEKSSKPNSSGKPEEKPADSSNADQKKKPDADGKQKSASKPPKTDKTDQASEQGAEDKDPKKSSPAQNKKNDGQDGAEDSSPPAKNDQGKPGPDEKPSAEKESAGKSDEQMKSDATEKKSEASEDKSEQKSGSEKPKNDNQKAENGTKAPASDGKKDTASSDPSQADKSQPPDSKQDQSKNDSTSPPKNASKEPQSSSTDKSNDPGSESSATKSKDDLSSKPDENSAESKQKTAADRNQSGDTEPKNSGEKDHLKKEPADSNSKSPEDKQPSSEASNDSKITERIPDAQKNPNSKPEESKNDNSQNDPTKKRDDEDDEAGTQSADKNAKPSTNKADSSPGQETTENEQANRPSPKKSKPIESNDPDPTNSKEGKAPSKGKDDPSGSPQQESKSGNKSSPDSKAGQSKSADKQSGDQKKSGSSNDGDKAADGKESGSKDGQSKSNKPGDSNAKNGDSQEGEGKGKESNSSSSKPGSKPSETGGKPSKADGKSGPNQQGGTSGNADGSPSGEGGDSTAAPAGDEANLEYNKQATELILEKLQKELERGDADSDLLKQLGWTPEETKRFSERISKSLNDSKGGNHTPESTARQQQFQEMLKNLDLNKAASQRKGANEPKRDVEQFESKRTPPPAGYGKAYEDFTRTLARQKSQGSEKPVQGKDKSAK